MSALLLDALGTLVALAPPAPRLRAELAARFGLEVRAEQAERAIAAEIRFYRAHLDEGRDPVSLAELRLRCAEVLRAELQAPELGLDALTEALLASLRFSAFPDAVPALELARAQGARVVVVSNWDASLPEVLDQIGLAPLLDGVVASAIAGARKPDAAIFERALALAGASPGDARHVGDSFDEDVLGARAAGIEPLLLRRDGGAAPPGVRVISSLAELT